jgi:hypothetical protein
MLHKDYDRKGSVARNKFLVLCLERLGSKLPVLRTTLTLKFKSENSVSDPQGERLLGRTRHKWENIKIRIVKYRGGCGLN